MHSERCCGRVDVTDQEAYLTHQEAYMTPFIIDDSKERYQERLDAAEQWRLAKFVRNPGHNRYDRLRAAIGDRLIAWGRRLKTQAAPAEISQ